MIPQVFNLQLLFDAYTLCIKGYKCHMLQVEERTIKLKSQYIGYETLKQRKF